MTDIAIQKNKETAQQFVFDVDVSEDGGVTMHKVSLTRAYLNRLGGGDPEVLIRKSFEFLLRKEPKESILAEFELSVIQTYFPSYEEEMRV